MKEEKKQDSQIHGKKTMKKIQKSYCSQTDTNVTASQGLWH